MNNPIQSNNYALLKYKADQQAMQDEWAKKIEELRKAD